MKRSKLITTACFTAVIGLMTLMNATAQDTAAGVLEKAILTFSAPVELPGMTLPAGTYVFRRPDANSARIIQVFSEDGMEIHGTFLTVPTTRFELSNENVVTFRETAAGATPAVRYWYYPMRKTGHEFMYPKDQAMRIAARTGETVLSSDGTRIQAGPDDQLGGLSQEAIAATAPVETTPTETVAQAEPEPAPEAVTAQAEPMPQEQAVGTSGQGDELSQEEQAVGTAGQADELPRTASPLALSGLIGLLSLLGAASLRRIR